MSKMLVNRVSVKWSTSNRKFLESMGYKFTKYFDEVSVKVAHLPHGSSVKVPVICGCGKVIMPRYSSIKRSIDLSGKILSCRNCAGKESYYSHDAPVGKNQDAILSVLKNAGDEGLSLNVLKGIFHDVRIDNLNRCLSGLVVRGLIIKHSVADHYFLAYEDTVSAEDENDESVEKIILLPKTSVFDKFLSYLGLQRKDK